MADCCVLCKQTLGDGTPTVKLREKGCNGINAASTSRGDSITTSPGQEVHVICRKKYCNPNVIKSVVSSPTENNVTLPKLRSGAETFSFRDNCLFCGQYIKYQGNKRGYDVYPVVTLQFLSP